MALLLMKFVLIPPFGNILNSYIVNFTTIISFPFIKINSVYIQYISIKFLPWTERFNLDFMSIFVHNNSVPGATMIGLDLISQNIYKLEILHIFIKAWQYMNEN